MRTKIYLTINQRQYFTSLFKKDLGHVSDVFKQYHITAIICDEECVQVF